MLFENCCIRCWHLKKAFFDFPCKCYLRSKIISCVQYLINLIYLQGDEEKKRGLTPIQMMDRDRKDDLPNLEVGFFHIL